MVDWDRDGDWDLLVRTQDELKYFEMRRTNETQSSISLTGSGLILGTLNKPRDYTKQTL